MHGRPPSARQTRPRPTVPSTLQTARTPATPAPSSPPVVRGRRGHAAHRHNHHRRVGVRMRRRGGRRAGAHTAGRPAGHRALVGQAADVRRGRLRCHTLGSRRLRATAAGQACAARHRHRVRTAAAAAAVVRGPAEKTVGGQTTAAASQRRPTPFPDHSGRRLPVVGLPDP